MEVNTMMSPREQAEAMRQAEQVNGRLRRPDGTMRGAAMDRNAFLRLLVTELRHQDPTQPMQDREFIAQMAQFSSLEQITGMNSAMQTLQQSFRAGEAYSMLGKRVDYVNTATGEVVSGTVSRVTQRENAWRLMVNGREIELSQVQSVYGPEARPAERPAGNGTGTTSGNQTGNHQ